MRDDMIVISHAVTVSRSLGGENQRVLALDRKTRGLAAERLLQECVAAKQLYFGLGVKDAHFDIIEQTPGFGHGLGELGAWENTLSIWTSHIWLASSGSAAAKSSFTSSKLRFRRIQICEPNAQGIFPQARRERAPWG